MTDKRDRQAAEGEGKLFERRDEVLQLFKRGAEFYEELIRENERLRFRNAALEEENERIKRSSGRPDAVGELERRLQELEDERRKLLERFQTVESANADFAARYAEIEEEHNTLANLYIASFQLHSTLKLSEVTRIIIEIAINLIGIGRTVLYVLDSGDNKLHPVAGDGLGEVFNVGDRAPIPLGEGLVGRALQDNERYVSDPPKADSTPLAVIPLVSGDLHVGALVLERFLVQKSAWSPVDFELFTLLGTHAGTALCSAVMRAEVEKTDLSAPRIRGLLKEGE